jgi:hypothetical protein
MAMNKYLLAALVVTALAACTPNSADFLLPVNGYLVENIVVESLFGGKVFCAYDVLGTDAWADKADVYVWALCGEYYLENDVPTLGTAGSLPVALHMQKSGEQVNLVSYEIPLSGVDYGPSIQNIFPLDAIQNMCEGNIECYNERAERLEVDIEQQAREYYGQE